VLIALIFIVNRLIVSRFLMLGLLIVACSSIQQSMFNISTSNWSAKLRIFLIMAKKVCFLVNYSSYFCRLIIN